VFIEFHILEKAKTMEDIASVENVVSETGDTPAVVASPVEDTNSESVPGTTEQTTIQLEDNQVYATRTVTSFELVVLNNEPAIRASARSYGIVMAWSGDLIAQSIFYDMTGYIARHDKTEFVIPLMDTLSEGSDSWLVRATEWDGWEELRGITFKTKKGAKISRVEKIVKLLSEVSQLSADIISAQKRLRTLQSTSTIPHGETGEMRFGSTVEIENQMKTVVQLESKHAEKRAAVDKHIKVINSKLTSVDTGWDIPLPELVVEFAAINPPFGEPTQAEQQPDDEE
jgi:hypothetical protein